MFPPVLHVQVAIVLQPALVGLHRQGPDQSQAAGRVGEDPDHPRAPPQLAIEAFQHVGRLHVLVVRQQQPVEGEGLLDVLLDPVRQRAVAALPALQPGGQVPARLGLVEAMVQPAQLLQAVVVPLARHVIQRVAQEMHVAALPDRLRENLLDRPPQPRVIVGNNVFDAT